MQSASHDPTSTKVDAALAAAERRHSKDPERAELIARARRFKASWIELAEALSSCQKSQRYTEWGYVSFEEYYRKELHLKTATVNKLVGSYAFLRRSAPEVLDRDGLSEPIPSVESIDFLRRAEEVIESGQAPSDLLSEVRRAVFDDSLSLGKLNRQFKESLFPSDAELEQRKRRKELIRLVAKLVEMLESVRDSVPDAVISEAEHALRALSEVLPKEEEEAKEAAAPETLQ
ncbi:MAG: hypothetical protein JNM40_25035 [Myxococcales bacterium]|nr:hypothetical protein [Myxococcales bacterium]